MGGWQAIQIDERWWDEKADLWELFIRAASAIDRTRIRIRTHHIIYNIVNTNIVLLIFRNSQQAWAFSRIWLMCYGILFKNI